MLNINIGDFFEGVLLETCRDDVKSISRPRVRPVATLPSSLRVEFPRSLREKYPIGTRFRANVKASQKHNSDGTPKGGIYLVSDEKTICLVRDYTPDHIVIAVPKANSKTGLAYTYVSAGSGDEPSESSFSDLQKLAYQLAKLEAPSHQRETIQRERSALIARYALCRSAGHCEGCGEPAPFLRRNGEPYLEVHHIIPVSAGGPDHPSNVAAICPNCHARVTHGKDAKSYNAQIKLSIEFLEDGGR